MAQGGPVAIAYAHRHPERVSRLILYGTFAAGRKYTETPEESEARKALMSLLRLGWGQNQPAFRQIFTSHFIPNATAEHQQWFDDLQKISASGETAARLMDVSCDVDVRDRLRDVKVPTLIIHCDQDKMVPVERGRHLAAEIPGARYVSLPSANHLVLEEEPAWPKLLDELALFLGWNQPSGRPSA